MDIPTIQNTLKDRLPRTSHQLINRVATQLSERKESAGSTITCLSNSDNNINTDSVNYSLGKQYGGDAKPQMKKPWKTNQSTTRTYRRLCPQWMRGVKGCFVCGENHRANTRHPPHEVTAAIEKLKSKHPQALITVEDLAAVVEMTSNNDEHDSGVQWLDDTIAVDTDQVDQLTYLTVEEAQSVESTLAEISYKHGATDNKDMTAALVSNNTQLRKEPSTIFKGIIIDTAANRRSVMCRNQHNAYQLEFGVKIPLRPPQKSRMKGIGGEGKVIGDATIPVPFTDLNLILDIDFVIMKDHCTSLLCNKDMINGGLDISIQGRFLCFGNRKQPLLLENYFFVHKWKADHMPYALYTRDELLKIHRGFGHPSVRATHSMLERAENRSLTEKLKKN